MTNTITSETVTIDTLNESTIFIEDFLRKSSPHGSAQAISEEIFASSPSRHMYQSPCSYNFYGHWESDSGFGAKLDLLKNK